MKNKIQLLILLLFFSVGFINCEQIERTQSNKVTLDKSATRNWEEDLQKASSFKEETVLLKKLIQVDSANTHQQLIANRLQTFDLRHLGESEKLTIIGLYELCLLPENKPSQNVLQTAFAKLNGIYPTDNKSINTLISKVLGIIENQSENHLKK